MLIFAGLQMEVDNLCNTNECEKDIRKEREVTLANPTHKCCVVCSGMQCDMRLLQY